MLVNLRKMLNYDETIYDTYLESDYIHQIPAEKFNADYSLGWALHFTGQLSDYCLPEHEDDVNPEMVNMVFYNLMRYCRAKEIDIVGCTRFAYNQIKDRKGRMIDGVWVKQEDL